MGAGGFAGTKVRRQPVQAPKPAYAAVRSSPGASRRGEPWTARDTRERAERRRVLVDERRETLRRLGE